MSKKNEKKAEEVNIEETTKTASEEIKVEEVVEEKIEEKPLDEKEILLQQVADLTNELAITKNAFYKAYADSENLKKRLQAEAEIANKYRIQSFALNILPALDSLELALAGKDETDPFIKGVKLTYDQLINALAKEGVSQVDCLNKPFDANIANAIMTDKIEGIEEGIVVEVFQKGYMLKDRLLRAALVKVSE